MVTGLALLLAAAAACTPVSGADRLWQPATRWVIVGEVHGTAETPAAFANLACLAAKTGRRVTIALEYSRDWQPGIDAFLASDGGPAARAALLTLPIWHAAMQDGRSSIAFLRMFDRLRQMKQAGQVAGVVAVDMPVDAHPGPTGRDTLMAQAWQAVSVPDNGIVLALVGNLHAMRKSIARPGLTIVTAGSLMPPDRTITVNVVGNGGQAWNCQADQCGPRDSFPPGPAAGGVSYSDDPDRRWDATYDLGIATTAAVPAICGDTPDAAVDSEKCPGSARMNPVK